MANFVALYDACVLHPEPLRDLLMHLSVSGLYRARWTERINDEWMRSVSERRPDIPWEQLERTRDLMTAHVPDCLVHGYEPLECTIGLPDPDDRHVLAAAIFCGAGAIVTYNTKDFPNEVLEPHGITVQHPDEFIEHAFDLSPAAICKAVRDLRSSLRNPPKTVDELFDTFLQQGLATTVSALREHADLL